jgi:hypothetical protein
VALGPGDSRADEEKLKVAVRRCLPSGGGCAVSIAQARCGAGSVACAWACSMLVSAFIHGEVSRVEQQ